MKKLLEVSAVIIASFFLVTTSSFAQLAPTLEPDNNISKISSPKISLKKRAFLPWENITFSYEGEAKPLEVKLTDPQGHEIEFQAVLRDRDGTVLDIEIPKNVKPGKYHVLMKDGEHTLVDEDFFWGVNFVNQHASLLQPGKVGKSDVVLFSSDGTISCEKDREITVLNTVTGEEKKQPAPHPECSKEKPNFYDAVFQTDNIGAYVLKVKNDDTGQELEGAFDVINNPAFDLTRESNTFVKKDDQYQVRFTLVANQDFEGNLEELVPAQLNPENIDIADVKNPDSIGDDNSTMRLALPFHGDYPVTLHFGEEPDPETHLLEAYRAYGVKDHDGIDFAIFPGTEIISVDNGTAIEIPDHAVAYGVTVVIQHSWGKSYYGHLSTQKVKPGDSVRKGDVVGLSGNTGLSTGPHLHFGIEPNELEPDNGYLGKIDPLESLALGNKFQPTMKKVSWNLSLKQGETVSLGYKIRLTDDSYSLVSGSRLHAQNKEGQTVYEDKNPWTYVVIR